MNERMNNLFELVKYKKNEESIFRLEYKKTCNLFPFNTRNPERPEFSNGFEGVTGAYTKSACGLKINEEVNIEILIKEIEEQVHIKNEEDKEYFDSMIRGYLLTIDNKINVFSSAMFQYCLFSNLRKERKGEIEIGKYLYNLFGFPADELDQINTMNVSNILEEIIVQHMFIAPEGIEGAMVESKIKNINDLFISDLKILINNEEYFLKYYPQLLAYYYFFYISQLSIIVNQGRKGNVEKLEKIFFLYGQESVTKSRKSYTNGIGKIKECSKYLLANINVLAQLNAIFLSENQLLPTLLENYENMDKIQQNEIDISLSEWIEIVNKKYNKINQPLNGLDEKIEYLIKLYKSEKTAFGDGTGSRYALWIEKSANSYFIRRHGNLGNFLYISQEFLLLMLFICKNGKRIKLKEFFRNLEVRGICLDSESKILVERRLNELGLLDKKSDSGEAAYV
ncbi:MAG: DNA phosphorothioation-dependent restriction protein DptG [Lachnospiraceae bacterium]